MYEQKDGVLLPLGFTAFVEHGAVEFKEARVGCTVEEDVEMNAISTLLMIAVIIPGDCVVVISHVDVNNLCITIARIGHCRLIVIIVIPHVTDIAIAVILAIITVSCNLTQPLENVIMTLT